MDIRQKLQHNQYYNNYTLHLHEMQEAHQNNIVLQLLCQTLVVLLFFGAGGLGGCVTPLFPLSAC